MFKLPVSGISELKVVEAVYVKLLPKSNTVSVYVPGLKPVATELVWALGIHVYEKGPMPPVAATVAEPKFEQVIDVLFTDIQGWLMLTTCFMVSVPPPQL